ncbi:DUF2316 family protein [Enterococcus sp. 669A]|uniref:DUF2316 family protein n=1 Tax=Candidatus Enterococcus moelleringii TaxID=2815325 RepID=A0ABS3LEN7_9ENTE|nr:DUF2316 family protein [Enterococcus sp. 669A]MBO1308083.1 DUF2316 family protein [Enterococcus sp. 669A]
MSLTPQQMQDTIQEFQENLALSGLSVEEIARDLHTTDEKIQRILHLQQRALEDPWIVKEYLTEKIEAVGKMPVPFTALAGDYHQYWFLNAGKIDKRKLSRGNS